MIVYHGSTIEIKRPAIIKSEMGRDFGFAFYTTDIQDQAERWAIRRAKIASKKENKFVPALVNMYEWNPQNELNKLKEKHFDGASMEWLDFVAKCRSTIHFVHGFDIVSGKIANDTVGETISYVVRGIMRKEDALERLRFEKINNQIAFCTNDALKELNFIKSYIVRI